MAEDNDLRKGDGDKNTEDAIIDIVENGVDDEPNFSDPENYVDDITEEELLGDLLQTKPKETDGVESVIVVDGIPQVGPDRFDKLKNVVHKLFSKFGRIITEDYPVDQSGKTKGYVFLEYSSPENALDAVKMTNGYKLDKQHIFTVNMFQDFDKYENIPDAWEAPKPQPYVDHGDLRYWLLDADCYDQYSVMYDSGKKTAVYLNASPEPALLKDRESWTESCVQWSPLGTYLSTFHSRGIALWGGDDFKQIMRFSHQGVQFIDFSPCENYLATFSPSPEQNREDPQGVIIWEVRTGSKKRSFHADSQQSMWPIFKWSPDDKYFARMAHGVLSIYETPSFGLLEKKSIKIPGIRNFSWSPRNNIIAYWVAEEKDVPARVTLLEIPSRTELRAKNLFNVADCKMHWQKSGGYLCVKVDRFTKAKKEKNESKYSGLYYNFEIFHMREKQIPVDSVEIKENITAFAWEPVGSKFAIIHGDNPHINVSFYGIKSGGTVSLLKKFERKQCNHLFWAPNGQFIVLAGLRSMNGSLEFVDTSDFTTMAQGEHFMTTDVEWDPTGRYVSTGVSWWVHKVDNAYWLWSFQGRLIRKHNLPRFCQLLWRPRMPTLLSDEKIKEIKKNLKKYDAQFDVKDRLKLSKASKELIEKRRRQMEEFHAYRQEKAKEYASEKRKRLELHSGIDTDELDSETGNLEEETVEFLVKEDTVVIEEEE